MLFELCLDKDADAERIRGCGPNCDDTEALDDIQTSVRFGGDGDGDGDSNNGDAKESRE